MNTKELIETLKLQATFESANGRIIQGGLMKDAAERLEELGKANQWQPIETAPKDGEFFVFMPTNKTPIQHCSARKNITVIGNCFAFDLPKPTHWTPLPKSPEDNP